MTEMDLTLARPRMRVRVPAARILLSIAAVVAMLACGYLWFRDSSFARVREVSITGLTSSERNQVRGALRIAARDMSTLHVREDALRTAVAPYASVADIRVRADFPHRLSIEVIEHAPVAALQAGATRVPVSSAGRLLRGVRAPKALPTIRVGRLPAGTRVADRRSLLAVGALGAAPEALRERVDRVWFGPRGLVLDLRNGPPLIFGDAADAPAKWAAAARVLADPDAAGATYLDVRVPGRVGAGGLQPLGSPTPAGGAPEAPTGAPVAPVPAPAITPAVTPAATPVVTPDSALSGNPQP